MSVETKNSTHPWRPLWHRPHAGKRPPDLSAGRRRLWARRVLWAILLVCACLLFTVAAVRHTTWGGPLVADSLRTLFGPEAVARLEDSVARTSDRWNLFWRRDEAPRPVADVPLPKESAPRWTAPATPSGPPSASVPQRVAFQPADVRPPFLSVAAHGDGSWQRVPDPRRPSESTLLWRTLLHPDEKRPWSELFVVAVDFKRVALHVVAGTREPRALVPRARSYVRRGLVAVQHRGQLLAAFNGGFKAEHGRYGMHVDGVTLIEPRDHACTIAALFDGRLRIATWRQLANERPTMIWFRQTPPCLVEDSISHPALRNEDERLWGAMPDGATVIRRSALGLNADASVLYMGVSNYTTASAIGLGMMHAGAVNVAELDVNWSFPHFVLFEPSTDGSPKAVGLFEGFLFDPDNYVRKPSTRDFFYLVRRGEDG